MGGKGKKARAGRGPRSGAGQGAARMRCAEREGRRDGARGEQDGAGAAEGRRERRWAAVRGGSGKRRGCGGTRVCGAWSCGPVLAADRPTWGETRFPSSAVGLQHRAASPG